MFSAKFRQLGQKLRVGWQHLPLKKLGFLSAVLPLVAVVASAALAFVGNQKRVEIETAINRHFEMVERLNDLLTLMLNAETGLRGHLLTRQPEFLEPYTLARQRLTDQLTNLRAFVEAEPGEEPRQQKRSRFAQIQGNVEHEMTLLDALQQIDATGQAATADTHLSQPFVQSKRTMDALRGQLRAMENAEKTLLDARLNEIRRVRRRDYLSISAALLLGLVTRGVAFWLFNRRVVRRVDGLTENVRSALAGHPPSNPPAGHHDAIGELEEETAKVCDRLLNSKRSD